MEDIDVPVGWASIEGHTMPGVCARHGEPAEEIQHVGFGRISPAWIVLAAFASLVMAFFLGVVMAVPMLAPVPVVALIVVVEKTRARMQLAWPYCARCVALHGQVDVFRRVAAAFLLLGVFAAVQRLRSYGADGITGRMMAGLLLGLLVMGLVIAAFSWQRLARAQVSRDRLSVRVKAHPRFAAAVRDRLAAERAAAGRT